MGCRRPWVSPLTWTLTALIIGLLAWASPHYTEALWAPGDLSRYHTDIATCGACHEPFKGATPQKCLACHAMETFQARSEPDVRQFHHDVIQGGRSCPACHTEHRGALAAITIGRFGNPHGEFIFRATGATSCSDCHMIEFEEGEPDGTLLRNAQVEQLIQKGVGAHRLGHFAKCLTCHRGGRVDVEDEGNKTDDETEDLANAYFGVFWCNWP
jgi:hypothetical protein